MRTHILFRIVSLFVIIISLPVTNMAVAREAGDVENYSIQIGAFTVQENVDVALKRLALHSIRGKSSRNKSGSTSVYFGDYANRQDAQSEAVKLKAERKIESFYIISSNNLVKTVAPVKETPVDVSTTDDDTPSMEMKEERAAPAAASATVDQPAKVRQAPPVDAVSSRTYEKQAETSRSDTWQKTDKAEDSTSKKEILTIAAGAEYMIGNTTYRIGYPITAPSGVLYEGYFPMYKMEYPLDMALARIDTGLHIVDSVRINGVFKKNFTDPNNKMLYSAWTSDPGNRDGYYEANISRLDALIFDVDLEWAFLKRQSWSLYTGLGYQYQKFDYEGKLYHQYLPGNVYGNGQVTGTYQTLYNMPYVKIGTDFKIENKFILDASFAWSPYVYAKNETHDLEGDRVLTGNMTGNAYMANVSAQYNFTPSWFIKTGFQFTRIDVDGDQNYTSGNGTLLYVMRGKAESTQYSAYLTGGYIF
jgi:hypothetical protein